jgi:hypothetical protein
LEKQVFVILCIHPSPGKKGVARFLTPLSFVFFLTNQGTCTMNEKLEKKHVGIIQTMLLTSL